MSASDPTMFLVADREVPLRVQRHPRARRISLRIDPVAGGLVLTLPPRARLEEGLEFVERKRSWIAARLGDVPARIPFAAGAAVPVLGRERLIDWAPGRPRAVRLEPDRLRVGGPAEMVPGRVERWLREHAREELSFRARVMAARLGKPIKRISVRDTRSRWGSCSPEGNLNFCWRLVLAPEPVLAYVVAHEVAHLRHMNHGPRFWALVEELVGDPAAHRKWLRAHGNALHRYG